MLNVKWAMKNGKGSSAVQRFSGWEGGGVEDGRKAGRWKIGKMLNPSA
jgi:hypothetical protein